MKPILKQITPLLYELEWKSAVSDELLQSQLILKSNFQTEFDKVLIEMRMGFKTLAIVLSKPLNPSVFNEWLNAQNVTQSPDPLPEKIWQIPVCYSKLRGRDIETLAKQKNLTQEELINRHSLNLYRLHFYGFLPGFMYLNGLPEELHSARKLVPDRSVPAGSVAIGGSQTGIYPSSSPGGWHLIGQTPVSFFDPKQNVPVFGVSGERIQFNPITEKEFDRLQRHPRKPTFK